MSDPTERQAVLDTLSNYPMRGERQTFRNSHYLEKADFLRSIEISSKSGDAEAAFRIYLFFRFTMRNQEEAAFWHELAAALGHHIAEYNLAVTAYYDDGDVVRARAWALKSAAGGYSEAKDLLGQISLSDRN